MFRGRGQGRGSAGASHSRLKGLFADGVWQCECDPRLPAEHFRVKKEGKNQGRWFYTCQKPEGRRCGFFLWDEDAKPREEAAVLASSRTEARSTPNVTPSRAGHKNQLHSPQRLVSPPPPYSSIPVEKRKAPASPLEDDEEFFPWPLTGEEEEQISKAADSGMPPPVTPRKAVKIDSLGTPGSKRKIPWLQQQQSTGLQTPTSASSVFTKIPDRSTASGAAAHGNLHTPATTPTPSRFREAPMSDGDDSTLMVEVFDVLREKHVRLDEDTRDSLRHVLNRHALKMRGVVNGRDISRLALKARDARIVELQHRVSTLEAELETERAVVKHLRWEKEMHEQLS